MTKVELIEKMATAAGITKAAAGAALETTAAHVGYPHGFQSWPVGRMVTLAAAKMNWRTSQ
ncbi:hypothetical protein ACFL0M_13655 [Thermodesulfobacteriota bacterium]